MISTIKPLETALKGKGLNALIERVWSISQRYGLTAVKMGRSLEQLSEILEPFNCQATWPVTAVALARNSATIRKYQARGIEFAIHGYLHVDYSQLSLEEQNTHLRKARRMFEDYGVHFEGFRSPYLRWNEHTLAALRENGLSYDSSASLVWDVAQEHITDSYDRALAFYGALSAADYPALPYLDGAGDLVRIPYCLPDDESLVERLRWRSRSEMNQMWPAMFRQTHAQGELFALGLHPERVAECSDALIATLQEVHTAGPAVWCARLAEIAAWWKARSQAVVEIAGQDSTLQLTCNAPTGATLLLRSLDVQTLTEPWFDGYQRASQMPCVVRAQKRPFIGVSPDAAPALVSFLKQQGYIVETSLNPDRHSFYLDRSAFFSEDKRRLIAQIEGSDLPLARLGRWPNGARSALSVTGDIDALTLWDYGLRSLGR
jgi:hypothetical protein